MPQWTYEFDVPEGTEGTEEKRVSDSLPTFRGLKVKFIFRDDHSAWFFQ